MVSPLPFTLITETGSLHSGLICSVTSSLLNQASTACASDALFDFETRPISKCSCRVMIHNAPTHCESLRVAHARIQDQLSALSFLELFTRRTKIELRCSMRLRENCQIPLIIFRARIFAVGDELLCSFLRIIRVSHPTKGDEGSAAFSTHL